MSDALLTVVSQLGVWERQRRLGLRPSSLLAGNGLHLTLTVATRVGLMVLTLVVLRRSAIDADDALIHGDGWHALLDGTLLTLAPLLVAAAGTAFGLASSASCKRELLAHQWLAFILLAQILLTAQTAYDPNPSHTFNATGAPRLVHQAAHLTAAHWGHDLLKLVGDPPLEFGALGRNVLFLALLSLVSLTIACIGLRR